MRLRARLGQHSNPLADEGNSALPHLNTMREVYSAAFTRLCSWRPRNGLCCSHCVGYGSAWIERRGKGTPCDQRPKNDPPSLDRLNVGGAAIFPCTPKAAVHRDQRDAITRRFFNEQKLTVKSPHVYSTSLPPSCSCVERFVYCTRADAALLRASGAAATGAIAASSSIRTLLAQ